MSAIHAIGFALRGGDAPPSDEQRHDRGFSDAEFFAHLPKGRAGIWGSYRYNLGGSGGFPSAEGQESPRKRAIDAFQFHLHAFGGNSEVRGLNVVISNENISKLKAFAERPMRIPWPTRHRLSVDDGIDICRRCLDVS